MDDAVGKVWDAVAKPGLTFMDAQFLHLAQSLGGGLVTADATLAKAARKAGIAVLEF